MFGLDDNRKIGLGLIVLGLTCLFLGVLFLFDRSLFIIGNLSFLFGLYFLVGFQSTIAFFRKKGKLKGSAVYFGGFFVIVIGFPFIGFCLQVYGLFLLFKQFFPFLFDQLCRFPVIGKYFNNPNIKSQIDKISSKGGQESV